MTPIGSEGRVTEELPNDRSVGGSAPPPEADGSPAAFDASAERKGHHRAHRAGDTASERCGGITQSQREEGAKSVGLKRLDLASRLALRPAEAARAAFPGARVIQ